MAENLRDDFDSCRSAASSICRAVSPNPYLGDKRPLRTYLLDGEYERPWVKDKRFHRLHRGNYIIWGFVGVALVLSVCYNYVATLGVQQHEYCLILDDQFSELDDTTWTAEVQLNGYGNGAFDWTTASSDNCFTDTEGLHITPTLTNESTSITNAQIYNGFTLDLSKPGDNTSCTGTTDAECLAHSNRATKEIIPPVRSARINTKGKKSIRYGRVEVVARLPRGDWLWPAIWMMPVNDTYSAWPASGEIDISESRGNDIGYPAGGRNTISSSLHWGPAAGLDAFWRTTANRPTVRGDYSQGFHTFGLIWSEDEIYSYVDNPLLRVLTVNFADAENLWEKGQFAGEVVNSSLVTNPWSQAGKSNAPFDQRFYLILNVAVGGTNGYFPDGVGGKPWLNSGPAAAYQFYQDVDQWYDTWPSGSQLGHRGMTVKSVKMWQEGPCT